MSPCPTEGWGLTGASKATPADGLQWPPTTGLPMEAGYGEQKRQAEQKEEKEATAHSGPMHLLMPWLRDPPRDHPLRGTAAAVAAAAAAAYGANARAVPMKVRRRTSGRPTMRRGLSATGSLTQVKEKDEMAEPVMAAAHIPILVMRPLASQTVATTRWARTTS